MASSAGLQIDQSVDKLQLAVWLSAQSDRQMLPILSFRVACFLSHKTDSLLVLDTACLTLRYVTYAVFNGTGWTDGRLWIVQCYFWLQNLTDLKEGMLMSVFVEVLGARNIVR